MQTSQKSFLDWNAAYYKNHSHVQEKTSLTTLEKFQFQGDEHILDIGCGDGKITAQIAAKVPFGKAIGIDASANMIHEAQKDHNHYSNLEFRKIAAEDFTFENTFDLIVSFFAFHYFTDQIKALYNTYKALKLNGTFILHVQGRYQNGPEKIFNQEPWKTLLPTHRERILTNSEENYKELFIKAGFKNPLIEKNDHKIMFDTKQELFDWALAFTPSLTGLSKEELLQFTQDYTDHFAQGKARDIYLNFSVWVIKAQK